MHFQIYERGFFVEKSFALAEKSDEEGKMIRILRSLAILILFARTGRPQGEYCSEVSVLCATVAVAI